MLIVLKIMSIFALVYLSDKMEAGIPTFYDVSRPKTAKFVCEKIGGSPLTTGNAIFEDIMPVGRTFCKSS